MSPGGEGMGDSSVHSCTHAEALEACEWVLRWECVGVMLKAPQLPGSLFFPHKQHFRSVFTGKAESSMVWSFCLLHFQKRVDQYQCLVAPTPQTPFQCRFRYEKLLASRTLVTLYKASLDICAIFRMKFFLSIAFYESHNNMLRVFWASVRPGRGSAPSCYPANVRIRIA